MCISALQSQFHATTLINSWWQKCAKKCSCVSGREEEDTQLDRHVFNMFALPQKHTHLVLV